MEVTLKQKVKAHIFTLPRPFAAPFFGCSLLMGAVLAGGLNANAWIALVGGLLLMFGGHSWNSFLDWKSERLGSVVPRRITPADRVL